MQIMTWGSEPQIFSSCDATRGATWGRQTVTVERHLIPSNSNSFSGMHKCDKWTDAVASIHIPGGRSLRPVKNRGDESVDKVVDQNFPLFSLGKLHL